MKLRQDFYVKGFETPIQANLILRNILILFTYSKLLYFIFTWSVNELGKIIFGKASLILTHFLVFVED